MTGLNAVYLILGTVVSVVIIGGGAYKFITQLKSRWIEEDARIKAQNEATKASVANTAAIRELAEKLDSYAQRTDLRLNGQDDRLTHLEAFTPGKGSS
jgi:hypothetical protein